MRIVLDMQALQSDSRLRGIGRHSLNLAKAIIRNKGEHEIMIVLNGHYQESISKIRNEFHTLLDQDKIKVFYTLANTHYLDPQNKTWREISEYLYENFIESLEPDLVHIFSFFEGFYDNCISSMKKYSNFFCSLTLYDLISCLNPALLQIEAQKEWYQDKFNNIKNADLFLAISDSTVCDAIEWLNIDANERKDRVKKIYNISSGKDDFFDERLLNCRELAQCLQNFNITKDFIFYSGGLDEHKNVTSLITAYAQLDPELRASHQLVIACGLYTSLPSSIVDIVNEYALSKEEITFTRFLSYYELRALYSTCKVFVFPSKFEGFGLPPLEAMQREAAVIGSNCSSIPEVIGLAEALFDPNDLNSIKAKLEQVLTDEDFRLSLIAHAKEQAPKFSWDKSAKIAMQAFEEIDVKAQKKIDKLYFDEALSFIKQKENLAIDEQTLNSLYLNFPEKREKYIFVDISELYFYDYKTGVQRATRSVLLELMRNPPQGYKIMPVYTTMESNTYYYARENIHNLLNTPPTNEKDTAIIFQTGDIFFGLHLQPLNIIRKLDFLQLMHNHGVKIKFSIYDLLPISMPEFFINDIEIFKKFIELIAQFDGVICISKAVQEELKLWYKTNNIALNYNFRFDYAHLGNDLENSIPSMGLEENSTKILQAIQSKPSILMVSTLEPRKMHSQAIAALELLWAKGLDINLVMVGKQGWNIESLVEQIIQHSELNKRLFWLKGISDEYLDLVYKASALVLMPSLGEGFGLALIEAARYNIPLLLRDIPVFREVAADHATYFSGLEAQDLSQAIEKWLELYKCGQAPSTNDMPVLSWSESTKRIVQALLN